MIAIRILKQRDFMSKLLTTGLFDNFLVEEAVIDTYNSFRIDGRIHREFYNDAYFNEDQIPKEIFSRWEKLRPICLELIKGKVTPLSFKFVFHPDEKTKAVFLSDSGINLSPDQVSLGFVINFTSGEVLITTGLSLNVFTLDKSAEKAWDSFVPGFMESNGISTEIL